MAEQIIAEYKLKVDEAVKNLNKVQSETKELGKGLKDTEKKGKQSFDNLNKSTNNLGNSFKKLGGQILSAFGIVGTVYTFVAAIKNAISVAANFERQMSKVQAITGASEKEISKLEASAKRLGSTTRFTATQVGELQEEFAKLGFSTDEILAATEATLSLAAAAGTTLAEAANVAGQVVRAFGLDASETQRVVDVMASSFSKSALNISSFQEAMKFAGPIARAAGVEVETVTALLSKLADAGLRGSIAGTGLKNLLSQLSDANSDLGKQLGYSVKNSEDLFRAFKDLQNANIDLTKATELTDERSKAAFITLINGADDIRELTTAYQNAYGEAERMATQMEDNFTGAVTRLSSAWEGLMLQIAGSNGYLKVFVELMTEYVNLTQRVFASEDDLLQKDIEANSEIGRRNALTMKKLKLLKDVNVALGVNEKAIELAFSQRLTSRIDYLNEKIKEQKDIIQDPYVLDVDLRDAQVMLARYEAELEVTRKTQDDFNKALSETSGDGGSVETYVRSIATLNAELKKLNEDFKGLEIGSDAWNKKIIEISKKTSELEAAMTKAQARLVMFQQAARGFDPFAVDEDEIDIAGGVIEYTEEVARQTDIADVLWENHFREQMRLQDEAFENEKRIEEERLQLINQTLSTASSISSSINQIIQNQVQSDLQALQKQFEQGELTREEFERKQTELQRKSAQAAKDAALFNAIIGTSQAIINALASPSVPFPVAAGFAALAAAQGAVQIAAIASEPLPQFKEGGLVAEHGLLKGKTHAQGGILIEAERDEYFMPTQATKRNYGLLEAMRKGIEDQYIMKHYVPRLVDESLFNGFKDMGRSAELNGITANLKDHNLLHSDDKTRQTFRNGIAFLGKKLDKLSHKNTRRGW